VLVLDDERKPDIIQFAHGFVAHHVSGLVQAVISKFKNLADFILTPEGISDEYAL
jgi:hypothetical protein